MNDVKTHSNPKLRCNPHTHENFSKFGLLLDAFRVRATRSLLSLSASMKIAKNDGNACMIQMTYTSTAHTELTMLEDFVRGVKSLPAGVEQQALGNLCSHLDAWLITKSTGDFRQGNYLSSSQVDLVREQVVRLLPVTRKNCVLLTDAWDLSDFELSSTIGGYDGDIYRELVKRVDDGPLNKAEVPQGYGKYLEPLIQSSLCVAREKLYSWLLLVDLEVQTLFSTVYRFQQHTHFNITYVA